MVQNSSYIVKDCEVAVELEFPPLNGGKGGIVKGSISCCSLLLIMLN